MEYDDFPYSPYFIIIPHLLHIKQHLHQCITIWAKVCIKFLKERLHTYWNVKMTLTTIDFTKIELSLHLSPAKWASWDIWLCLKIASQLSDGQSWFLIKFSSICRHHNSFKVENAKYHSTIWCQQLYNNLSNFLKASNGEVTPWSVIRIYT